MMVFLKRSMYLLYYLKNADRGVMRRFLKYAVETSKLSRRIILLDMLKSVYRYNISIQDYFYFRFFEISEVDRKKWAGTGFMYEYQKVMNPKETRSVLEDKIQFLKHYHSFVRRKYLTYSEALKDRNNLEQLLNNGSGKLVLKGSLGQVGAEVSVIKCEDFTAESLLLHMKKNRFDLIEEFVVQHSALMQLSSSGLNTIRIFSQVHNGKFYVLGARLRITVNSAVDNMAAGNLAAPVNINDGIVDGPGVYSDITKEDVDIHPVTGISIKGFKIPFWEESLNMVKEAALYSSDNKSIGWDVAIGQEGPELIEGNHNWCKLLWQLPVKKGLKSELLKYV